MTNKNLASAPEETAGAPSGAARNIETLRDHLFDQLDRLKKDGSAAEFSRARAVSEVAARIIDSVKAETEFVKVTGEQGTNFVGAPTANPALPPGMTQGTIHRLRG